jgi:hypothetical protein
LVLVVLVVLVMEAEVVLVAQERTALFRSRGQHQVC